MGNKRKRNTHRELLILKRRMKQLAVFGLVVYSPSEQLFCIMEPNFLTTGKNMLALPI